MTDRFDVVVIGGGPGGHAAAVEAASHGVSVALIEAEALGGQCVHATCIPNAIVAGAARTFVDIQELGALGVTDAVDEFRLGRAGVRRAALVRTLAQGVALSLEMSGVEVIEGRGVIDGGVVRVGDRSLEYGAIVLATGSRWEPPTVPGAASGAVVTPDAVHHLERVPASATVIAGGTARTAFSLETAAILAISGADVRLVTPGATLLPWFDEAVDAAARAEFETLGLTIVDHWSPGSDSELGAAELVVAPDRREPFTDGLGLETLGWSAGGPLRVDRHGRTSLTNVYAAGDMTGGAFLTQAATLHGRAAGAAAAGHAGRPVPETLPHALHFPEMAWVGLGAAEAEAAGWDVVVGAVDIAYTAAGIVAGGRTGLVSLVAERELGAILGAQIVGPGAGEIAALVAAAIQAELTAGDVAGWGLWHPSPGEAVVDAARQIDRRLGA